VPFPESLASYRNPRPNVIAAGARHRLEWQLAGRLNVGEVAAALPEYFVFARSPAYCGSAACRFAGRGCGGISSHQTRVGLSSLRSCFSSAITFAYDGLPSTVMTRGRV